MPIEQIKASGLISNIKLAVCAHFGVTVVDLTSERRTPPKLLRARHLAFYLCRELTPKSYPEIGRRMGGRDHTTILHACKKIERLLETDEGIVSDLNVLRERVEDITQGRAEAHNATEQGRYSVSAQG
jgi:chromosomal replication initiator protein